MFKSSDGYGGKLVTNTKWALAISHINEGRMFGRTDLCWIAKSATSIFLGLNMTIYINVT